MGLPPLIINRVMRRQPLCIHHLHLFMKPKREASSSLFQRLPFTKRKSMIDISSSSSSSLTPSVSMLNLLSHTVTADIPTPDIFKDRTGYTFSAVTLGSNPLYNWSMSTSTVTDREYSSLHTSEELDRERDVSAVFNRCGLEESEALVDWRPMSINGSDEIVKPRQLWIPPIRTNPHEQQCLIVQGQRSQQWNEVQNTFYGRQT